MSMVLVLVLVIAMDIHQVILVNKMSIFYYNNVDNQVDLLVIMEMLLAMVMEWQLLNKRR